MGLAITGSRVWLQSSRIRGASCTGPREQFKPMASAPRPSRVWAMEGMEQPAKVRPDSSKVMVTATGSRAFSLAASRAALAS